MERARFVSLVHQALSDVPHPFREYLKELDIVVKRRPSAADLVEADLESGESMYGFYRGVPLPERDSGYHMALPDVIHIYQEPLEEDFPDERELIVEIRTTVLHELAHHFGIDDHRLGEIGME